MPYSIKKQGEKWVKINRETGKVVSHHDSKEKAEASVRAYYANKNESIEYKQFFNDLVEQTDDSTEKELMSLLKLDPNNEKSKGLLKKRLVGIGLYNTCSRCGGTGEYSFRQDIGNTCLKCGGSGKLNLPINKSLIQKTKDKVSAGELDKYFEEIKIKNEINKKTKFYIDKSETDSLQKFHKQFPFKWSELFRGHGDIEYIQHIPTELKKDFINFTFMVKSMRILNEIKTIWSKGFKKSIDEKRKITDDFIKEISNFYNKTLPDMENERELMVKNLNLE